MNSLLVAVLSASLCRDIYLNSYLECIENDDVRYDGSMLSVAAESWLEKLNPVQRHAYMMLCQKKDDNFANFQELVCK